jgi:hypothetical protein
VAAAVKRAAVMLALAACGNPPPFAVDYALTPGPSEMCMTPTGDQATKCSDVKLRCDSTLSVRIVSPDQPDQPYIELCEPITGLPELCSIAAILLPEPNRKIPAENLDIQVAIYPTASLCTDPNDPTRKICPASVPFDYTTGLPVLSEPTCNATNPNPCECPPMPAIGGSARYQPGDRVATVELGCRDQQKIEACIGRSTVTIAATVEDFDTQVSVAPATADQLSVSVGEPRAITVGPGTEYVLAPGDARVLTRTVIQPVPGWGSDVDLEFVNAACIETLEDAPQSTSSLACRTMVSGLPRLDITGFRLGKPTLDQILAAIGLAAFPTQGLVIGIVLDDVGNPLPNFIVNATASTIQYLSADRKSIIAGGTSSNGIFVSRDAPFGTTFTTRGMTVETATGYGGLVDGKVTIVVLQFGMPTHT